jgi:hypothetical protein
MAPDLVAKHWRRDHTVASAMMGGAWIAHITGPRTIPMMVQYVLVREALEGVELTHGRPDSLIWWWSSTRVYSASSAFNTMFLGQPQVPRSYGRDQSSWKNVGSFGWLVLHDTSWISDRLWRHGLRDDNTCALCDQED